MDYFISFFWGTDPIRTKFAQEFCDRYPQVILLQNGNIIKTKNTVHFNLLEEGFIDYKMLNIWLVGKDIRTLTLIDSDLILSKDFFDLITEGHRFGIPSFLTYKSGYELIDNKIHFASNSMVYNHRRGIKEGHTGYVLSFNDEFLKAYQFDDSFIHGGYDYFLTNAILGKCMSQFVTNFKRVPKTYHNYIETSVIHQFHGPASHRKTPWELYNKRSYGWNYKSLGT